MTCRRSHLLPQCKCTLVRGFNVCLKYNKERMCPAQKSISAFNQLNQPCKVQTKTTKNAHSSNRSGAAKTDNSEHPCLSFVIEC